MSRITSLVTAAALAASALAFAPVHASAADYAVGGDPGPCSEARHLKRISSRFDHQVRHVPNLPQVSIVDFQNIHERRYIPESEDWPIERRYCGAKVVLSDGAMRDIWYLIEGRMGFAGMGDNVEFCVSGFDRWYVYNGACRVLR